MLVALEWDGVSMVAPTHSSIGTVQSATRIQFGAVDQHIEQAPVMRPPSVPDRRRRAGVIGCMSWAAMRRGLVVRDRIIERVLCAELGDRSAVAWLEP
jgi:hypothetical protein